MGNIGYAVFGTPKGIKVLSNGLFKELEIDKSLYLNSSHIVLDGKQRVLLLRRIPSDLNNLNKKDAILVALYENALQYGENRPGGFLGSAICFREKLPNSEKLIKGLLFLFSSIKNNVDDQNRFKSTDTSTWDISLPKANQEFGMLISNKYVHTPLTNASRSIKIQLHDLELESAAVLTSFALNHSLHDTQYLYTSDDQNVIKNLNSSDFTLATRL